ncbi:M4 family metallopeptidase [Novosphingobium sp.]|uniref:M4 family metallopeptidase n=1 Tax=Novosphingobium sp. TaxID=1874826 RepID=UPI0025E66684|nr:M4 family metallopeptidase [Novosphingobium sp.]
MTCNCFIIPDDVLERFASDPQLSDEVRQNFHHSAALSRGMRSVRDRNNALTMTAISLPFPRPPFPFPLPHRLPVGQVFDCHHGTTLPGAAVANPGASADPTIKRAYVEEESVARFYWNVFKRDSIDGHHMTLISSVHYGVKYNNAFWNGAQMTYGDGDGQVFLDFTLGDDVIGHELTHGVTQHSLGLVYSGEAGGLNESMSDVFGSMFRQWEKSQTTATADWLIGADIMGPVSKGKGYTCLRDMAAPKAAHALAAQPDHYYPGIGNLDPHYSSGVPNLAFTNAAKAIGGHSWEKAGQVWYKALTGFGPSPNMTMSQFASRTRALSTSMFPAEPAVHTAVHNAWTGVGL